MKKILLVMAVAIIATSMSSCERKYTCTCVYPDSGIGTTKTTIRAYNKREAERTCDKLSEGAKVNDGLCAL